MLCTVKHRMTSFNWKDSKYYSEFYVDDDFSMEKYGFKPKNEFMLEDNFYSRAYYQKSNRPPKNDEKLFIPKLTFSRRSKSNLLNLTLESSLPKIMFGSNLFELKNSDFDYVCNELVERLKYLGIRTNTEAIAKSHIERGDFAKNIILPKYVPIKSILEYFYKGKIGRLSSCLYIFANNGAELRIATMDFEIVFYDKTKDLERESTFLNFNILRIEVRLKNTSTIFNKLSELGIDSSLKKEQNLNYYCLSDIFDERVSKIVILHYWNMVLDSLPIQYSKSTMEILSENIVSGMYNSELSYKKIFEYVGMSLVENNIGSESFNHYLKKYISESNFYAVNRGYKEFKKSILKPLNMSLVIDYITEQLEKFEMIDLATIMKYNNYDGYGQILLYEGQKYTEVSETQIIQVNKKENISMKKKTVKQQKTINNMSKMEKNFKLIGGSMKDNKEKLLNEIDKQIIDERIEIEEKKNEKESSEYNDNYDDPQVPVIVLAIVSDTEYDKKSAFKIQIDECMEYALKCNLDVINCFKLLESDILQGTAKYEELVKFCSDMCGNPIALVDYSPDKLMSLTRSYNFRHLIFNLMMLEWHCHENTKLLSNTVEIYMEI